MSAHTAPLARRAAQIALLLATAALASCVTKKETASTPAAGHTQKKKETEKEKEKKPTPTPAPTATPAPSPTPEARYFARVSVEGQEVTQQEMTPANAPTPTPSANPSPTPAPTPEASPTPTPKPAGFFTRTWQKFFPPKATPAPTPGPTGRMTARVTTREGGTTEQVLSEGEAMPPPAGPTPAPIPLKPRESLWSKLSPMNLWHMIFPKKEPPPPAMLPQWIGTIKSVNERDGYVLIDSQQGYYTLPEGEMLNSVGGGSESGVLRVTADRNPPFFIADVVGGKPRAGDRVYSPKP